MVCGGCWEIRAEGGIVTLRKYWCVHCHRALTGKSDAPARDRRGCASLAMHRLIRWLFSRVKVAGFSIERAPPLANRRSTVSSNPVVQKVACTSLENEDHTEVWSMEGCECY